MALTYQTAYDLTANAPAVQRVSVAAVTAAIAIYNEAPATTGHDKRATLATAVLANPDQYGKVFIFACVATPAIIAKNLGAVTDADLLTAVTAAWNLVAGA